MTDKLWDGAPLSSIDVETFLPHRRPMVLIDEVLEHDHDSLLTATHIRETSPYFDAALGGVPNYVGIEYMAQSIAALAGVEATLRGEPIQVGFLLGSRKLSMPLAVFAKGETYTTEVKRLYQEDTGLAVFDCRIFHGATQVAEANVNVFQPQDTDAYIRESQGSSTSI